MPRTDVDGVSIAYEIVGEGRAVGPDAREVATARTTPVSASSRWRWPSAATGSSIWDRPNCGESDVCFRGDSESEMQADVLAGLLRKLDLAPAVVIGGSGGARVSLLAANRHRDVAHALGIWWISGGVYGLLSLASYYCAPAVPAVWNDGLEAVMSIPSFEETFTPARRIATCCWPRIRRSSSPPWSDGWRPTAVAAGSSSPASPTRSARPRHPRARVPQRRV